MQCKEVKANIGNIREILVYDNYFDILYEGETGTHVAYDIDNVIGCTCASFKYRGSCKHIKLLGELRMIYSVKNYLAGKESIGKVFPSSLENVNEAFGGKMYSSTSLISIYGKSKVGKTLFLLQDAYYLASLGYNVLYIDTEGASEEMIATKFPIFETRFGKLKGDVFFSPDQKDLESLAKYLGYDVLINLKTKKDEGGKLEFAVLNIDDVAQIEKDIISKKIDVIMLDSITAPLSVFQTSKQQNLPARSDCIALILRSLIKLQNKYNVAIANTGHATFNPADMYAKLADIIGGRLLHHYSKRMVYIDTREGKGPLPAKGTGSLRRFWIARYANIQSFSLCPIAEITDIGYIPVTDEKVINLCFTETEKGLLKEYNVSNKS